MMIVFAANNKLKPYPIYGITGGRIWETTNLFVNVQIWVLDDEVDKSFVLWNFGETLAYILYTFAVRRW